MKLVPDKKYPNLFRIKWRDGTVSVSTPNPDKADGHYGFYNKTWAQEHIRNRTGRKTTIGQTYNAPWARLEARGEVFLTPQVG